MYSTRYIDHTNTRLGSFIYKLTLIAIYFILCIYVRLHWASPYSLYQIHPSPNARSNRPPIIQVLLSYITSQVCRAVIYFAMQ